MGNFSISHFSRIQVGPARVEIRYILDMEEIPTFQEMQATGIVADPHDSRVTVYLAAKAEAVKAGLAVELGRRVLLLETVSEDVIFPAGAGGLPTMKIGFVYRARFQNESCSASFCALDYRDGNLPDRAGWKEIVAGAGPGVEMRSSTAPASSRSHELANYPTDLINSPPQELSTRLTFTTTEALASGANASGIGSISTNEADLGRAAATAPRSAQVAAPRSPVKPSVPNGSQPKMAISDSGRTSEPNHNRSVSASQTEPARGMTALNNGNIVSTKLGLEANRQGTPRNRFTELIASNQWGFWFLLTAALIAAALGGLHALEPGHGKTIVAAYLVGSQGTAAHALWLGAVVTVTHTAGVYALGVITLYAFKYVVPERLYPWLGVASGLTIAALGLYMLQRRLAGQPNGHSHDHGHHRHHYGFAGHSHPHERPHHAHDHEHAGHDQVHAHHHHDHDLLPEGTPRFSYRQLIALGVTGGIVPCPAALVVLLSAVSLHRMAFGLYLILAFSVGLAAVLISIGLVTVYARRFIARVPTEGPVINRWLPMASAAVITCLGTALMFQGLQSMGVVHFRL